MKKIFFIFTISILLSCQTPEKQIEIKTGSTIDSITDYFLTNELSISLDELHSFKDNVEKNKNALVVDSKNIEKYRVLVNKIALRLHTFGKTNEAIEWVKKCGEGILTNEEIDEITLPLEEEYFFVSNHFAYIIVESGKSIAQAKSLYEQLKAVEYYNFAKTFVPRDATIDALIKKTLLNSLGLYDLDMKNETILIVAPEIYVLDNEMGLFVSVLNNSKKPFKIRKKDFVMYDTKKRQYTFQKNSLTENFTIFKDTTVRAVQLASGMITFDIPKDMVPDKLVLKLSQDSEPQSRKLPKFGNEDRYRSYLEISDIAFKRDNFEAARKYLRKAFAYSTDKFKSKTKLSEVANRLYAYGEYNDAAESYQLLVRQFPENKVFKDKLREARNKFCNLNVSHKMAIAVKGFSYNSSIKLAELVVASTSIQEDTITVSAEFFKLIDTNGFSYPSIPPKKSRPDYEKETYLQTTKIFRNSVRGLLLFEWSEKAKPEFLVFDNGKVLICHSINQNVPPVKSAWY
jgi:tetratricopeptide (TPR) repeat protein